VDTSSGGILLSATTSRGRDLLEELGRTLGLPYRLREVKYSFADLARIQEEVTSLRAEGVPGAELIWKSFPDYRDNRIAIVLDHEDDALLAELASRFGAGAIAIKYERFLLPS
jgi:hypothetical protein